MFETSNVHHEAIQLGIAKDNYDHSVENTYIANMEKISDEIDEIGKFLDLSASLRRQAESKKLVHVNFWNDPESARQLEQMRVHCPNLFHYHQNSYHFHIDDLKRIEDGLHAHITNDCNARQTQLQTMFAQHGFKSQAIFDCMASINRRFQRFEEKIRDNSKAGR